MGRCQIVDCEKPVFVKKRSLCRLHYDQWWRAQVPACSVDGCDRPRRARGMCEMHSDRMKRNGTTDLAEPKTSVERFWANIDRQPDGCWEWVGPMYGNGYGQMWVKHESYLAHRFAYELLVGPVPDGMDLDHLCHGADDLCPGGWACRHRRCVRPAHLEPVTRQVNIARGLSANGGKTHCKRGHEFTEENTKITSMGGRACRACALVYNRERMRKQRAKPG